MNIAVKCADVIALPQSVKKVHESLSKTCTAQTVVRRMRVAV